MPRKPESALDVALRALRAADRSRAELDERLRQKGFAEEERDEALEELERLGYLDDERVARLRAERLAERGYGDAYIEADLTRRGLPVSEALAALAPEAERAGGRDPAVLARRGFASDAW